MDKTSLEIVKPTFPTKIPKMGKKEKDSLSVAEKAINRTLAKLDEVLPVDNVYVKEGARAIVLAS